nr:uncharacterized protein LOC110375748 [Helicoverpa armigera]
MGLPTYPECSMKRETAELVFNKEIADELGRDFRVLPVFEKGLFDYKYRRFYSLNTNKLLGCRWSSYVDNFSSRELAPFQFIDIRDYHFFNCVNRLKPSETIYKKKDFRYKLKPGPGVDYGGQMPIPQDLLMKRGAIKIKKQPRQSKKDEELSETKSEVGKTKAEE